MNSDTEKQAATSVGRDAAASDVDRGFCDDSTGKRFVELYEQAPVAYLTLTSAGQITQVNRAGLQLLKAESSALSNRRIQDFLAPHSCAAFESFLQRVFAGDSRPACDVDLHLPFGETATVHFQGSVSDDGLECRAVLLDITQRTAGELALRDSQKRYKTLIDHTPFCVHEIDLEGRLESINRAGLQMLCMTDESEVFGLNYMSFVSRGDYERIDGLLQKAKKGQASHFEFQSSGEQPRFFKSCFIPIKGDEGQVNRILGISEDVTERKLSHEKLRRGNLLLEASQSIGKLGGWELDLSSGDLFWTAETYRLHDTSPEEFNPTVDAGVSFFLPESQAIIIEALKAATEKGEGYDLELETYTTKGRRIDVRTTCVVSMKDGTPYKLTGIFQDITEQKRADVALRESQAKLELAIAAAHIGPWSWDLDTGDVYFSPEWKRQIGYEDHELKNHYSEWVDRLHPEDRQRILDAVQEFQYAPEDNEYCVDFRFRHRNGSYRWIHTRGILLFDWSGQPIRMLGAHMDFTDRKLTEERLLHSQRLESLGTLAGGVAHDLNNALAPILMGAELLRINHPEAAETAALFEASAKRAADMSRQLLTFAKGADGERCVIHVEGLIEEIRNLMRGSFPVNIEVQIDAESELPTVMGDATQIHRILLNLCVNSRDAMPEGGILRMNAREVSVDEEQASRMPGARMGSFLRIDVSDTGLGIRPEHLDRIFEPFFSTKELQKGTGLGLSTVMGIVKGHDGFLQVTSQPQEGTTVAVYLPTVTEADDASSPPERSKLLQGNHEMVLVVDDEQNVRDVARLTLSRLNFKVLTASDGAEGLAMAMQHKADLKVIIVDLHMPRLSGLEMAREVRARIPELPILVCSGRMDSETRSCFESIGVDHFLDKPFTLLQLTEELKELPGFSKR